MSFAASSEEGITLPVTRGVPSMCAICVRLRSGQKATREGLASSLGSRWQGVALCGTEAQCPLLWEELPGREMRCSPPALTPRRVGTGRRRGGEISQPSSVSQAFGRRPPPPEHL